jgi:hypothetical protein
MQFPAIENTVRAWMWSWYDVKQVIERSIAFSSDSLHVLTGVVLLLGAALVLRRPISRWRPWLVVFALICLNELIDLKFDHWPTRAAQYGEGVKDMLLTLALPTLLLLAARFVPRLFKRG